MKSLLFVLFAILAMTWVAQARINKCETCQVVVHSIEQSLQQNNTLEDIVNHSDTTCNFLPKKYFASCQSLVKKHTPQIISRLAAKDHSLKICSRLHQCRRNHLREVLESDF
ncbi:hypothetical protein CYY_009610, partial [Polysphondylium violaceum]